MADTTIVELGETYTQLNGVLETYMVQNVGLCDVEVVAVSSGTPAESSRGHIFEQKDAGDQTAFGTSMLFARVLDRSQKGFMAVTE
jgi:mannose-6-phosphate isomerase class I